MKSQTCGNSGEREIQSQIVHSSFTSYRFLSLVYIVCDLMTAKKDLTSHFIVMSQAVSPATLSSTETVIGR